MHNSMKQVYRLWVVWGHSVAMILAPVLTCIGAAGNKQNELFLYHIMSLIHDCSNLQFARASTYLI